jgi:hypothetical protein
LVPHERLELSNLAASLNGADGETRTLKPFGNGF